MDQKRYAGFFPAAAFLAFALPSMATSATVDSPPRIVSMSPHITELLFAAGAGERVVGIDDSSDYPAAASTLPKLGEANSLDVEKLLRLRPTLVILWGTGTPPRLRAQLQRLQIRVVVSEQRHLDDIGDALIQFGGFAGTEAAAAAAAAHYRAALSDLRMRFAGRRPLTVFYQVWDRPLYTLSGEHVVSEVISLCGGVNIFGELQTLAPAVDREAVLVRDPEVILIGAAGAEGARLVSNWSRFASQQAVRKRHIFLVNPSLISRMGPRILEGAAEVCESLEKARDD